jgi:hypothetical protein
VTRRRYVDELAELGVPAERRPEAAERIATAVSRTLQDERGRWLLDARHTSSANELALTGRVDERQRLLAALHRLGVRRLHLRHVVDEQEFPEVVAHRRARVVLARGPLESLLQRAKSNLEKYLIQAKEFPK